MSGKVIAGVGTVLGSARAVGAAVGAETLPSHRHTISSDGNHNHLTYLQQYNFYGSSGATAGFDKNGAQNVTSGDAGVHSHGGFTGYEGTGSHGVVQPTIVLNYIIKN